MSYIEFNHIVKEYATAARPSGRWTTPALLWKKASCGDSGASGAGKTTALNILGGMDTATSGQVLVDGQDITRYTQRQLVGYRRTDIGLCSSSTTWCPT